MHAREGVMQSSIYGEALPKLYPIVEQGMSDSGAVDNVLEFLCMAGGRELPEVGSPPPFKFQCMAGGRELPEVGLSFPSPLSFYVWPRAELPEVSPSPPFKFL